MIEKAKGRLVIIGGAEDKQGDCIVLRRLVDISGKNDSKIIIVTAATEYPNELGKKYANIFKSIGAKHVETIDILHRKDANDIKNIDRIKDASCVFFTGGDQLRITSIIGGTLIQDELQILYEKGVVIAGTSAGASVMSETMIVSGNNDDSPRKCTLKMSPGLGLLKGVVIDQHFAQRGRIGRLLTAIAQNPSMLGIGIDEDTAIVVMPDASFEVVGSNAVTIVDATKMDHTNVSELKPDEILALTNITIHVLPNGYKFDINKRQPVMRRY